MSLLKNKNQLIAEGSGLEEKKTRRHLLEILEFALERSDPFRLTRQALKKIDFEKYQSVFVIGAGKGAYRMALATEKFLEKKIAAGWVNVPAKIKNGALKKIKITLAGHPFPNQGSLKGAKRILSLVKKAGPKDLVLALFSGGASALFCLPAKGISLSDKIRTTKLLLRSGAAIQEINAARKHLSRIKGGWLAQEASQTNLAAFYLSDVVGNDLSVIASGPTAPDPSTFQEATQILKKHKIWRRIPRAVRRYLKAGERGEAPETPKKDFSKVKNIIIGSHRTLVEAVKEKGEKLGYKVKAISDQMAGETHEVGKKLLELSSSCKGNLLVAAGETAFKVCASNPGGRNQQMALAILPKMPPGLVFLAFDSDGVDGVGPEKIGGVIIDNSTRRRAQKLNLDIKKALRTNDSYRFFKKAGGQIKTGYIGTNLGDLVMILIHPDS